MSENIILLGDGKPSIDYYIVHLLKYKNFELVDFNKNIKFPKNSKILIVRYIDIYQKRIVEKNINNIKSIYYFMDDDLFDLKALKHLPLKYAWKIFTKSYIHKSWLIKNNAKLLVSNEYLAGKYKKFDPQVILPYPIHIDLDKISHNSLADKPVIFYHATASHVKEFYFLRDLIKSLQDEDVIFEIVADRKFLKLYKGLKNVILVNPMSWESYLKFSSLKYRHIGLALLFDDHFNRARSYVKLFNIVRSGAVGIYSEFFPESRQIEKYNAGYVLPMDVQLWKKAVLDLVQNPDTMNKIFLNSLKLIKMLKEKAEEYYKQTIL